MKFLKFLLSAHVLLLLTGCGSSEGNDSTKLPTNIYELNGTRVSCISGSLVEQFITDSLPDSKLISLPCLAELLTSVSTGKSDYLLIDQSLLLSVDPAQKGCEVLFETSVASGYYSFGFNYPESELSRQLNAFIEVLKENGMLDEILSRWSGKDAQNVRMPDIAVPTSGEPIRVAAYLSNFPFGFIGSEGPKGIEPEILYRFGEYIGRPIKIDNYDFAALMPALVSRKADIITGTITVTEERAKKTLFSTPYFYSVSLCIGKATENRGKKSAGQWIKEGVNDNLITEGRWKMILDGLRVTVLISILSILFGSLIGAFVCWMRMTKSSVLREIAKIYLEILRGIPMLVFLMLMFYVVFASSSITSISVAVIAFAMNFGAFTSEIFRTGIESIDKGQKEAGIALGFTNLQTFLYVILPQAVKKILPVFKNEAVSLVKNTAIVGYIAIQDLTKVSDLIRSRTFDAFFPLIVITVIYFILAWLLGHILDQLTKRI